MIMVNGIIAAIGMAAAIDAPAASVKDTSTKTVTVVPGARYQASWFRQLFLGGHWRDAWNTPVDVPVLDLRKFDGGLTTDRQGGGVETYNLRFKSNNGRTWVFRSVDKNPRRKLDPDTAEGWIGALLQDLTSGAYPCAPLMVSPFLEAAGVFHATPQLAVLPDDPELGEFRAQFGGMLGTVEERPESNLPGVDKVEDTLSLFERLEKHSDEHVDAADYLRVRLVEILVGDWDRHIDQYRWVRVEEGGERVWRTVPRDRDEAFSRFDGAFPSIIEYYGKPIVGWGDTYPPIDKITFAARYTDRRFLIRLERAEWEAVTAQVVANITDAVISEAVHRIPPPLYAQSGAQFEHDLRSRRDLLTQASKDYYRLLAHDVDVRGTTSADDFEIERNRDGSVSVSVYARPEKGGERATTPYFHRTFLRDETSEIRLYTMGGGDRVLEKGDGPGSILLRVVSPPGTSEIIDRSPAASATKVYAPQPPVQLPAAKLAALQQKDPRVEERMQYEVNRDWGRDYLIFPQLSYDSTRGLLFGAYLQRTGYGFQLDPYASQMDVGAVYSTTLSRPRIDYGAIFTTRSPVRILLYAAYSGIEQAAFFGFGNESPRNSNLTSTNYYNVYQNQIIVNPLVDVPLIGALHARAGVQFKHAFSADQTGIIATLHPPGSGGLSEGSAEAALVYDERSGSYPLVRSFNAHVTARYAPSIFSNPSEFGKVRGAISGLYGTRFLTNIQLSVRVAGERNFGTYPFFESAFLGGVPTRSPLDVTGASIGNLLRGYDINRFAGDAAVVANSDLNFEIGKYTSFLPLRYGVFGLFDIGRVFLDGESSSKWHNGVGGGIWLGLFANSPYFQLAGSLKAALVHTEEGLSFYLASGFGL